MKGPRHYHYAAGDQQADLDAIADTVADAVYIDLEDGVMPSRKDIGRRMAHRFLAERRHGAHPALVRINKVGSPDHVADLDLLIAVADYLVIPLLEHPDEVQALVADLEARERAHGLPIGSRKISILVETPAGATRLREIIEAGGERVRSLMLGAADFTLRVGCQGIAGGGYKLSPIVEWLNSVIIVHARAAGVDALTMAHARTNDADAQIAEMRRLFGLGYDAMVIGTAQAVERVERAYVPDEEDLAFAANIQRVYEEAVATSGGIGLYDGWLVEGALARVAQQLLQRAPSREFVAAPDAS
jgi:citrate lyase subunit beta/citryl-CoA lyase